MKLHIVVPEPFVVAAAAVICCILVGSNMRKEWYASQSRNYGITVNINEENARMNG